MSLFLQLKRHLNLGSLIRLWRTVQIKRCHHLIEDSNSQETMYGEDIVPAMY